MSSSADKACGEGGSGGGAAAAGSVSASPDDEDCPDLDSYVEDNLMQGDEVRCHGFPKLLARYFSL